MTSQERIELQERPLPSLKDHEVLVQNLFSLVSPGTELSIYLGTHTGLRDPNNSWAKYPFIPGYAAIGKITQIGKNVSLLREEELIYYFGHHAAFEILDPQNALFVRLTPSRGVPLEHFLFARLLQIAYTSVAVAHSQPRQVLVTGAGLIGLCAAQLFQNEGTSQVMVLDKNTKRLQIARDCGIFDTINSSFGNPEQEIRRLTGGQGVDMVIEATGVPALVPLALEWVNKRGEIILLGSTRGNVELDVYRLIHSKGAVVTGAHEMLIPLLPRDGKPNKVEITEKIMLWIAEKKLKIGPLISHILSPDQSAEIYRGLSREQDKYWGVVLDWGRVNGVR